MANPISGGKDFSAEKLGDTGIALTTPMEKNAGNAVTIRAGHAVTRTTNTKEVARAAVTSNYVSAAAIYGFANHSDASDNYLSGDPIVVMPMTRRPNGKEQILVHPATPNTRFRLGLKAGQVASGTLIGKPFDIAVDATTGEHSADPSSHTVDLLIAVDIYPDQEGVDGGSMYFIVPSAKSQFDG